jgi:hypothetical protein
MEQPSAAKIPPTEAFKSKDTGMSVFAIKMDGTSKDQPTISFKLLSPE